LLSWGGCVILWIMAFKLFGLKFLDISPVELLSL
jgi:hypothetical protein